MIAAFVLITVPPKKSGEVVAVLHKYPEIREVAAVYGDTDIIVKIEAPSLVELDEVIMEGIQANADVKVTRTYIVIQKLHWAQ